ncbi:MAG: recombinase family protein [Alphaproteobacteria bacterium]
MAQSSPAAPVGTTLDLQPDALCAVGCETIYQEHASGKNAKQPELEACLKALREGDVLVVWRLDRLGRSLLDLVSIVNDLKRRGVQFDSLTERIDTGSSTGQLIFHIFASLAEFERNLIRERTLAGLKAARARGRKGGRPRRLTSSDIKVIAALVKTGDFTLVDIAKRFAVSRTTLWRNIDTIAREE